MFTQNRLLTIFELLNKGNEKISCKTLSKAINVSERTIRTDISALNKILLNNGASIKIKRSEGYYLHIHNLNLYQEYLAKNTQEIMDSNEIPNSPIERNKYILKYILYNNDYIKLEDLADKLFVSKITILNDIKKIKNIISKYDLALISKPYHGLKIHGKELDIRRCISENIINRDFENYIIGITKEEVELFKDINLKLLQKIVLDNLYSSKIEFSDFSLKNFIIHLAICISRINSNHTLDVGLSIIANDSISLNIVERIFNDIEENFHIKLSKIEKVYIYNHFKSKSTPSKIDFNNTDEKIVIYTKELLEHIFNHYNFDLRKDKILFNDLLLHFKSILNCKYYNLNKTNPLINSIKSNYPLAFEITLIAVQNVFQQTVYNFTEDEIGYVSLHIGAAIERYFSENMNTKNVILVCGSGYGTSRLLEAKLNNIFRNKINIVECLSYNQYKVKNFDNIDLIISTIPLKTTGFPVILVDFSLLNNDIELISKAITDESTLYKKLISNYFDKNLFIKNPKVKNKDDLLNLMGKTLLENEIVFPSFIQSVLYRESISSTNIDEFLAIPHPMELNSTKTRVCVALLQDPIEWNNNTSVKLVMMLAINKDDCSHINLLYDVFLKIINQISIKDALSNAIDYNDFLNILNSIIL